MPDPNLPTYVTSLDELFWGVVLVALTLVIHGIGMVWVLRFNRAFQERFAGRASFTTGMLNLIFASWLVLFVHIAEVMIWAGFFQWKHCFPNYSIAAYFSLNEYTTVGSALSLPSNWRLLEGMIATAGLLGFAWSTGVLLTLAQAFQEQQLQEIQQRRDRRHPKRPAPGKPTAGAAHP